jgi:hypothetical protein
MLFVFLSGAPIELLHFVVPRHPESYVPVRFSGALSLTVRNTVLFKTENSMQPTDV